MKIDNNKIKKEFEYFYDLINQLEKYNYIFVDNTFNIYIYNVIKNLFPKLNDNDLSILNLLTCYLIEDLTKRIFFIETDDDVKEEHYYQWKKNNNRDILALSLTIIPFMSTDNNGEKYNKINDLNQMLYDKDENDIDKLILEKDIKQVLKDELKYTNFSIGLLRQNDNSNSILKLKYEGNKLIYIILHHQFCSVLETIKITNGKLYVNWINTRPIKNYLESNLYKKSKEEIDNLNLSNIESFKLSLVENKHLWYGDYFNVLRNGYYESIKKIKWTIFNKKILNQETNEYNGVYMIQYLDKILDFYDIGIYDNDKYLNLSQNEQINFKVKIDNILKNLTEKNVMYKDSEFELNIIQNLLIWMLNNSNEKFRILTPEVINIDQQNKIRGNEYFLSKFIISNENIDVDLTTNDIDYGEDINDVELNDDEQIEDIDVLNLLKFIISQNHYEILWNYIKDTIEELKETIYGSYLFTGSSKKNKKIDHTFFYIFDVNNKNIKINLKNLYNIAKQLSYRRDTLLGINFKNLTLDEQYIFFRNFTNPSFNFTNNIIIQEGNDLYDINDILGDIESFWEDNGFYMVFDYLYKNGLVSEFSSNLEMTDEKLLPMDSNVRRNKIKFLLSKYFDKESEEKDNIFNTFYYLTNDTYKNLPKFNSTDNKRFNDKEYKKALLKELSFYMYYAMDWIAQINFFNHFINNQVIFVTGSTGTGKSTQVPKLLMYGLKMYDYNNKGKVICTQPRISPTEGNSTWISTELGIQNKIKSKDETLKTDQYYSQYKYQGDKHSKDNCNHLTLKMVTDGTLLEEISNNIIMKEQIKIPDPKIKDNLFSIKNSYDIIIIDEAHEHNVNMDIILSLARHSCFYNNSIRLVIVSATMDDDEPIYRSYFQNINDNLLYPIKQPIIHPLLLEEFYINSTFLDRRVHISAPGQTTQFNITENYNKDIEKKFGSNEKANSILAQNESYKKILEICNNTTDGEILLFLTGEGEIKKALEYLNDNLPSNVVALPYYSRMNETYRNIIGKIDNEIKFIRNDKRKIVDEWGEKFVKTESVPIGTYKRTVIVATNVAEASITIPNLKFVVDTGYEKSNQFDSKLDIANLEIKKISEASRIQRKGRVGRVAAGTVYYMYGFGQREKIKPKYGITQVDFHNTFLKLSEDSNKKSENLVRLYSNLDLNNIKDKNKKENYLYLFTILSNNLEKVVNYQLTDLPDDELFLELKQTGFSHEKLIDNNGIFYIIHPFETYLQRNIMNEIINFVYNKNIVSNNAKIKKSIKQLFNPMLKSMEYKCLYLNLSEEKNKDDYKKTIYSEKILEVTRDITSSFLEESESISLLIGKGYNIELEVAEILSMLSACNKTPSLIAALNEKNKKIVEFDKFKNRFSSESDIISLYNICILFRQKLSKLKIYQLYRNKNIYVRYKKGYDEIVKEYKTIKRFTLEPGSKLMKHYNILNQIKVDGKLNDESGFLSWLEKSDQLKQNFKKDIESYYPVIENICKNEFINPLIIKNYFSNLLELILGMITIEKETDKDYQEISPFEWTDTIKGSLMLPIEKESIEEKINYTFLLTNPLKIGVRFNMNDNYYLTLNSQKKVKIDNLFNKENTLCKNISSIIFYYNYNSKNDTVGIISNANVRILSKIFPIHYNPKNIKNIYFDDNNNTYMFEGYNWDNFIYQVKNYHTFTKFPLLNSKELKYIYKYTKKIQKNI